MSIKTMLKLCSAATFLLLVFAALGPAKWIPRSGLRLAGRPFRRLFRAHVDVLLHLGAAVPVLEDAHGRRRAVREPSSFYARIAMPIFKLH